MQEIKLTLVRHGRTDWNAEGRVQGSIDRPLDDTGHKEAQNLFHELKDLPIDKIISSDLQRAFMTAKILAQGFSHSVEAHPALREICYGEIEGRLWADFRAEYKERLAEYERLSWPDRKKFKYTPSSESHQEVIDRVIPFLNAICSQNPSQHMMVVTHGGVIKVLLAEILGVDDRKVHTNNTGYVTFIARDGSLTVDSVKGVQFDWVQK